jgi:biopolymer transport protein ExbB
MSIGFRAKSKWIRESELNMYVVSSATQGRARLLLGLVLCAALASVVSLPRYTAAQDDKPTADKTAEATGEKSADAEKPSDAAADEKGGEKKKGEEKKGEEKKEVPQENFLVWVMRCSGTIGLVILLLSIYFVSTVGRLFWEMRLEVAAPPAMVQQCQGLLEQRDFKGIYNLVKDDDTFFSHIVTTGIAELPNGLPEARDAMERTGDAITSEMEKRISMLAVLGTLGPMIGLLGTLKGMIAAFGDIARSSGVQLEASKVANSISESLLLTFEGVALSVPAIFFYALFRNRVVSISTSVMLTGDQFLRHFSHAGRAKASSTAPATKPAP